MNNIDHFTRDENIWHVLIRQT